MSGSVETGFAPKRGKRHARATGKSYVVGVYRRPEREPNKQDRQVSKLADSFAGKLLFSETIPIFSHNGKERKVMQVTEYWAFPVPADATANDVERVLASRGITETYYTTNGRVSHVGAGAGEAKTISRSKETERIFRANRKALDWRLAEAIEKGFVKAGWVRERRAPADENERKRIAHGAKRTPLLVATARRAYSFSDKAQAEAIQRGKDAITYARIQELTRLIDQTVSAWNDGTIPDELEQDTQNALFTWDRELTLLERKAGLRPQADIAPVMSYGQGDIRTDDKERLPDGRGDYDGYGLNLSHYTSENYRYVEPWIPCD